MRKVRIQSRADLEALPEGEWVEVPRGIEFDAIIDDSGAPDRRRVVIPLDADTARRLRPRAGEVLEATMKGSQLELVRRRTQRRKPSRN